ncbi:acyl-CoA dehydrogenase family protein [uncultured Paracoccus sp.]|uniref:acyl-CoA dehydrogenase family protein n=1 Tax=uncultured Paracoccus sp. TaxID=189685 RepID=UPI00260208A8|nr:acyl-CoA dehydrogenase family protein [uncultured Paracoccus sp.]
MPLYLDDDQIIMRDSARSFMADQASVAHLRSLRDAADPTGFSTDLWKRFVEMGFSGILIPEADGGMGLGHVEAGIVLEEIGRNLTPSPFLSTGVGVVTALGSATPMLRERWYPAILTGRAIGTLAIDEGTKHHPERIALKAERSGKGFRLSGEKRFVQHGHVADVVIVSARTGGDVDERSGVTLFAVDGNAAGLTATPQRLLDASLASRLTLEGVEVEADAVIGEVDGGWDTLSGILDACRAAAAAELVGVADAAMAITLAYIRERRQFGVPVGSFQALQHRAAHLYSEIEVARAAVLKAQQRLDAKAPGAGRDVLVAKAMAGLAASLAAREGVQMHGGVGMTDDYDIGLYMKRGRVLEELFGDTNRLADRLAQLNGY